MKQSFFKIFVFAFFVSFLGACGASQKSEKMNGRTNPATVKPPKPKVGDIGNECVEGSILPECQEEPQPSLKFLSPAQASEAADASFIVKIETDELDESGSWSLYYSSGDGPDNVIASNIPLFVKNVNWYCNDVAEGKYNLFAKYKVGKDEKIAKAEGSVQINHNSGNQAPIISLTNMNGEELILQTPQNIRFTASDADADALTFKYYYSNDNGANYSEITGSTVKSGNDYTFSWAVDSSYAKGYKYRVKVVANDGRGATTAASSDKSFAISDASVGFSSVVLPIFSNSCATANCHGSANPNVPVFNLLDYNTVKADTLAKQIADQLISGAMPKNSVLPSADITDILSFIWGSRLN